MRYECNRFVDINQLDKQELSCGICLNIFREPMTFCRDCITDWLNTGQNICLCDRTVLMENDLLEPPRGSLSGHNWALAGIAIIVFENMLGRLNIRCDYADNGCPEVMSLNGLAQHADRCPYDTFKCKHCFCKQKSGHDCIQALLALNRNAKQEIARLKQQLNTIVTASSVAPVTVQTLNTNTVSFYDILMDSRSMGLVVEVIGVDIEDKRHQKLWP
ncbi:unnamed protein product [Medioppia subpectinata]|uniref:Uncharacterized protein n=1 Tax=Medioppia subpectinata TaxID=1979941 RepID=A0A7R9Q085_9ACAR|nr:unnamed protein product [Medioppia subpectinata]CAG2107840.1 unnamed protein product [Medioppia subpectinata]